MNLSCALNFPEKKKQLMAITYFVSLIKKLHHHVLEIF